MTLAALSPDIVISLATITGEAGASSPGAWAAVSHVIMNRAGKREWKRWISPGQVCANSGFDAFTQKTPGFRQSFDYFSDRNSLEPQPHFEEIIKTCHPILLGQIPDDTDNSTFYFSPKTQAILHQRDPLHYAPQPKWDFSLLIKCLPPNMLESDDFEFWRYII